MKSSDRNMSVNMRLKGLRGDVLTLLNIFYPKRLSDGMSATKKEYPEQSEQLSILCAARVR